MLLRSGDEGNDGRAQPNNNANETDENDFPCKRSLKM
jgi:hypothetical protein